MPYGTWIDAPVVALVGCPKTTGTATGQGQWTMGPISASLWGWCCLGPEISLPPYFLFLRISEHEDKSKLVDHKSSIRVASWNVGSIRGRSGELVEVMARRRVDVCCIQEVRYRGESARLITGKNNRCKLFWSGNDRGQGGVGIMVAEKLVKDVMKVVRVSDRIMFLKMMMDKRLVTILSVYAPQVGLSEEVKDRFWDELIRVVRGLDDNDFVILAGDLNGHVGSEAMGYEGIHGGWGYGTRNAEGERILEFALAMNMVICNTAFKKRESHLVTYRSGGSSSQIDYFLVRKSNRGLVKDTKVIPSEECVQQHKLLISDFRLRGGKTLGRKYVPRRRVWKLKEKRIKEAFYGELSICMEEQAAADSSVNEQYKALKGGLLKATDLVCGWTKGPPKHRVTWWWNEDVEAAIKEKRRLYKDYRKGGSRVEYEVAKRVAKREVYKAKSEAQRIWLDRLNGAEGKKEVFREAARVRKENRDIIGEQCVRNDSGRIVVDNEGLKEAWRAHYERLLNVEFEWDREGLAMAEPVLGPWPQIDEDTVRRALQKMKTGKAAGVSGLTSEMLKAAGDKGVVLMKDLINAIICECTIPDDWLRSIIVNVFKGKGDALDRGNYRGIKLLDQGMKVLERVLEGLIRDRVSIDGMQFGFMPGRGTTDAIFIVRQLQERFIERKKDLFFVFVDLEKAFDRVPREVIKWAMRKLGIEEWLVRVVMALYEGA